MLTTEKCVTDIKDAVSNYGVITYYDKGPFEVMDIDIHVNAIKKMEPDEAATILSEVLKTEHGEPFVRSVLIGLDEWEHFDKMLDNNNCLADVY